MQKTFSQIIGLSVVDEMTQRKVALINDIIVDPETGKVLAFAVDKNHIIVSMDVERLNSSLYISDKEHIIPIDDVLRVKNVREMRIGIIGEDVITRRGKILLGTVTDYEIDTTQMAIKNIYVAKTFLFFHFAERIISIKDVVKIEKNSIIVKDDKEAVVSEEAKATSRAMAV